MVQLKKNHGHTNSDINRYKYNYFNNITIIIKYIFKLNVKKY